ncbi:hypothetical protein ARMSODRAFT_1081098 [Armillaria solidipes]|uniref:Fungal-type protein kinase domain-containing protein n=1 Tax=Armillaria solidipes TaxID=1076256 RepID=A0A2H3CBI2_9AGAR|nr:hypothetical protein ARMSODRAFT_1081098 [Armillaria solidipes]
MPKGKGKVRSSKVGGRAGAVDKGKKKAERGDAVAVTQHLDVMALLEQLDPHEENRAGYRNLDLGREMARRAVGPMPIEEFIDCIPESSQRPDKMMPDSRHAFSKVPERGDANFKNERSLYDPVNQAFNATRKTSQGKMARCPGVTFYNTSEPGKHSTKVGASGYAQEHLKFVQDPGTSAIVSHPAYWQLFWEAKIIDFTDDDGILFEHITDEKTKEHAIAGFGQASFFAAQMCANQFRDFAFSISLTDETARLLRWDRSGVIFSEAIHYRENPEPLCRFLWRFGNANSLQRGADMSVHKRITEAEEALFRDTVKAHVKLQLGLTDEKEVNKEMEKHYEPGQVCMVEVVIHQDSEDRPLASSSEYRTQGQKQAQAAARKFLVSRPVVSPRSLASRSTRGYWAVDMQTEIIVFLKDCWRVDVDAVDMEGLTLQKLRESGVEVGVPTVVCHGDVYVEGEVSSTLTSKYSTNEWNKASKLSHINGRIHYRIVTAEVGYALQETFAGTRELIKGCQEVFYVLFYASTKANLIHRDISSTNIILVADETNGFGSRVAYVIDWEFAVAANRQENDRDRSRVGTVAFMCINALPAILSRYEPYSHFFGHDVESLIYVALYCGLYRLPWKDYSEARHQYFLRTVFGCETGRGFKAILVTEYDERESTFQNSEFQEWLIAALNLISMWYPTPASLPPPEAIRTEFSATVEVDPSTLEERDAIPRKMPILWGLPIEATNSTTRSSSPSTVDSPNETSYRLRNHVVELSPSAGAPKRGRFMRERGRVGGSTPDTVGRNTRGRERGQVPGSSTFNTVGVRTRGRKRPGNESDGMGDETDAKHRKKRRK